MSKKVNAGGERLIPKEDWIPESEIQGAEIKTLQSPLIERAFRTILQLHQPKHNTCLVSLCTSTRPYSKSPKWKKFIELWGDKADMIICSNGGIIPIEFESEYPYLTYDAHGDKKYDKTYVAVVYRRLKLFFETFHYDRIIFNFRPNLRNRISAVLFKRYYHPLHPEVLIYIRPTKQAYEGRKKTTMKDMYFPDLDEGVLKEIDECMTLTTWEED